VGRAPSPAKFLLKEIAMQRPLGVTAIAALLFLIAAYLATVGSLRLAFPDAIRLSLGAPLLHGLEISGPYMFLLGAVVAAIVAYGLLRLKNLARRAAILIGMAGIVLLIPKLSGDAADLSVRLFVTGFAVMIRVAIVWYLWQSTTAEKFR
jgi:hypothetical protein